MEEELTVEEKIKAMMDFFGLSRFEAESELEDMGEINYEDRKEKPR